MKIYHTASGRISTGFLERLRIVAEYVSTVQRSNEDHVCHRLDQIFIPPLCICRGLRASLKNVIRISDLSCLFVCDLE